MNPLTNMKNVKKLSEQELQGKYKTSWHDQYKDSAWIFVGGLPYDLTEGDIICVFSQYGEIVNVNLIRDKGTGKSKGFCFICFEDQRSTNLAVDNFNGIKLLTRTIRVDHVESYKAPKDSKKIDEETRQLYEEGCAPGSKFGNIPKLPSSTDGGLDKAPNVGGPMLLPPLENLIGEQSDKPLNEVKVKKEKKEKKKKKQKKTKSVKNKIQQIFKKKPQSSSSESSSDTDSGSSSSSSSSSDSETERLRKKRKKIEKKKRNKNYSSSSDDGDDSENSVSKKRARREKKVLESNSESKEEFRHIGRNISDGHYKRYEDVHIKKEKEEDIRRDPGKQKLLAREDTRQDLDYYSNRGRERASEKEWDRDRDRVRVRDLDKDRDHRRYIDGSKTEKNDKNSSAERNRKDFRDDTGRDRTSSGGKRDSKDFDRRAQWRDGNDRDDRRDMNRSRNAR